MPTKGQQLITACAFIYRYTNGIPELFIPKRAITKKFLPGVFELPGGHIEYGESLEYGLKREIKEEFNRNIIVQEPYYAFTYMNEVMGSHSVEIVFFACFKMNRKDIKIDLNLKDHSEYLWLKRSNLKFIINANKTDSDPEIKAIKKGFSILNRKMR